MWFGLLTEYDSFTAKLDLESFCAMRRWYADTQPNQAKLVWESLSPNELYCVEFHPTADNPEAHANAWIDAWTELLWQSFRARNGDDTVVWDDAQAMVYDLEHILRISGELDGVQDLLLACLTHFLRAHWSDKWISAN